MCLLLITCLPSVLLMLNSTSITARGASHNLVVLRPEAGSSCVSAAVAEAVDHTQSLDSKR